MAYKTIVWEQSGAVGRLTLNRPESLNAWTPQLGFELRTIIERDAADDSVRAVLITGAGRGFSSGADLKAGIRPRRRRHAGRLQGAPRVYHPAIAGVRRLPKPVVAAVNGPAVGIGCSLALCLRPDLAAESAFFGLAFVNIGLCPTAARPLCPAGRGASAGPSRWRCSASASPSPQALEWGLVNWVHPDDRLNRRGERAVERMAGGTNALLCGLQAGAQPVQSTATSTPSSSSRPSFSTLPGRTH